MAGGAALQGLGVPAPAAKAVASVAVNHKKKVLAAGAFFALAGPLAPLVPIFVVLVLIVGSVMLFSGGTNFSIPPSATASATIPANYLAAYEAAGDANEVPWPILAGIGAAATNNGTTSPYDHITRTVTYPTVSPPIGGGAGQGAGPMLLNAAVADTVTHGHPQSVTASVAAVASALYSSATALAAKDHLDYGTVFTEPISQNTGFWESAITSLDAEIATPNSCTPPPGTAVDLQIEEIWSCEMGNANVSLQISPWATLGSAAGGEQLIAEALDVAWAYSRDGTTNCAVFPLPAGAVSNPCDPTANIEKAATLVIGAASTPPNQRTGSEWSVLPGVDPNTSPEAQPAGAPPILNPVAFSAAVPPTEMCANDIEDALNTLPEPGPFSPGYPGGPPPANAASAWAASNLAALVSTANCEPVTDNFQPTHPVSSQVWEQTVGIMAANALMVDQIEQGGASSLTDLSGLVSYLESAGGITTATFGQNAVVPRLSNPPAVVDAPAPTSPMPLGAAPTGQTVSLVSDVGFAAQAVSAAAADENLPGSAQLPAGAALNAGATAGIPPGWVQWAEEAVAKNCPGLSPAILLGIGFVETTWGTSTLPGVSSGANFAGAEGPMQFEPSTFASYATDVPVQPPNIYNPQDALFAAAAMLCADGAPGDLHKAILAYNHADWYVNEVLAEAQKLTVVTTGAVVSGQAGKLIAAAETQLGVPYVWGAESPGAGFDCSGLADWALQQAGYALPGLGGSGSHGDTAQDLYNLTAAHTAPGAPQPGDLVFFGTSTTAIEHVGIYIGNGDMVDAPNSTTVVRTEPYNWPDFVAATAP